MNKFYFSKSLTVLYFVFWLTIFLANLTLVICMVGNGQIVIGTWIVSLVLLLGPIGSLKYLIAAQKNIPALIITTKYIHSFQLNKTIQWEHIQEYSLKKQLFIDCLLIKYNDDYINSIKNSFKRYFFQLYYQRPMMFSLMILNTKTEGIMKEIDLAHSSFYALNK